MISKMVTEERDRQELAKRRRSRSGQTEVTAAKIGEFYLFLTIDFLRFY